MSGNDSGITSGDQQSLEQGNVRTTVEKNEANAESTFDVGNVSSSSDFSNYPKTLNESKQGKHIPGHNNYQEGKSELTITMSEASNLVSQFSGKGMPIGDNKERVNFRKTIGIYKDPLTGTSVRTTIGVIHYSKTGTHIVPARPKGD
jgi:hypothetical protein